MSSSAQVKSGIMFYPKLALIYAGLWALLSQNQGWGFGLLFILLATWCAHKTRLRLPAFAWRHLPAFLVFFLQRLVVGGIDVALRTVAFKPAVTPAWADYKLNNRSEDVRLSLSAIVGLLPGTLAAKIENNTMRVHLLDAGRDWQADVAELESRITLLLDASSASDREQGA